MAAQLLVGLTLLVLVHEMGHYLAARAFGIKVDKFYIFFDWGFKFYSKKIGDTEFGIGWLPLGGYCKISGMIDESMDKEQMKKPPEPWEFRSKPAWQRFIVMIAGVVMNVILGIIIFTSINLVFNREYLPIENVTDGIYAYEYAHFLGFEHGDKIVSINGKEVERFEDVFSTRLYFGGEVIVSRDGEMRTIQVPDTLYKYIQQGGLFIEIDNHSFVIDSVLDGYNAEKAGLLGGDKIVAINNLPVSTYGAFKEVLNKHIGDTLFMEVQRASGIVNRSVPVDSTGKIGIWAPIPDYELRKYTFFKAMHYGSSDAFEGIWVNIKGFKLVFKGTEKARNLSGPIGIAKVYGGTWDWYRFWSITGMISMVLAFINILPVPALDGGHALFTFIEAITRRKFSDKFMEITQYIGLVLLLLLMTFVIGNDIINLFR